MGSFDLLKFQNGESISGHQRPIYQESMMPFGILVATAALGQPAQEVACWSDKRSVSRAMTRTIDGVHADDRSEHGPGRGVRLPRRGA